MSLKIKTKEQGMIMSIKKIFTIMGVIWFGLAVLWYGAFQFNYWLTYTTTILLTCLATIATTLTLNLLLSYYALAKHQNRPVTNKGNVREYQ